MVKQVALDGTPYVHNGKELSVVLNDQKYARAESDQLLQLLTYREPSPTLTKSGKVAKRQPKPHVDPPADFYIAQLHHYGMDIVKQKDTAKRHLLNALRPVPNSGLQPLKISRRVMKIESELKDKFEEKYGTSSKTGQKRSTQTLETGRGQDSAPKEPKKSKAGAVAVGKSKGDANEPPARQRAEPSGKVPAASGSKSQLKSGDAKKQPALPAKKASTAEIRKGSSSNQVSEVPRALSKSNDATKKGTAAKKDSVKDSKGASTSKNDAPKKRALLDTSAFKGCFSLTFPPAVREWLGGGDGANRRKHFSITLLLSSSGSYLLGQFHFEEASGIIRSISPSPLPIQFKAGLPVRFEWRSKDDHVDLGQNGVGEIRFLSSGRVKGKFTDFEFKGKRIEGQQMTGSAKYVAQLEKQWEEFQPMSYPSNAYREDDYSDDYDDWQDDAMDVD